MWVFSDVGTTARGEALYSFTHRTFLEYFAAAELAYKCDTPERLARSLAPRVARHEWEVLGELAVLIKDHASDRGAQRVYATLIGERRRRAAPGRSGILQFLARCLRSVDPSPQTVRLLSRQVLDHLFAGDTNAADRFLPLCWLAASCANFKEIVYDELSKRIDSLMGSVDRETQCSAVSLTFWLPTGLTIDNAGGPNLPYGSPIVEFWRNRTAEIAHSHVDFIRDASRSDAEIRYGAFQRGVLSIDDVLEASGGLLTLMQLRPTRVFQINWAPHLISLVWRLTYNEIYLGEIQELSAVGRYLDQHPNPPWVDGEVYEISNMNREGEARLAVLDEELDSMSYLGAAAILLMGVEFEKNALLRNKIANELGPLNDLQPYIQQRWGRHSGHSLPGLPIPPFFGQAFHDWAQSKISFANKHSLNPQTANEIMP
jgi:hypothetical protein